MVLNENSCANGDTQRLSKVWKGNAKSTQTVGKKIVHGPQLFLTMKPKCRGQHPVRPITGPRGTSLQIAGITFDYLAPQASELKAYFSNDPSHSGADRMNAISIFMTLMRPSVFPSINLAIECPSRDSAKSDSLLNASRASRLSFQICDFRPPRCFHHRARLIDGAFPLLQTVPQTAQELL
jgi:hypothetical protein